MLAITKTFSHTTFATEEKKKKKKKKLLALVITHLENPLSLRCLQIFRGMIGGEVYINHSPLTYCFPGPIKRPINNSNIYYAWGNLNV